jgi:hypothetical protein
LEQPRDTARELLLACLSTAEGLTQHSEAYAELVFALAPDLSAWFRWIDGLPPDAPEDVCLYAFNMLGELARRGHADARAALRAPVLTGAHWHVALAQYLLEGVDLDVAAWSVLLPRLPDDELDLHIHTRLDSPVWAQLAELDERVWRLLRERREQRERRLAREAWSEANYAQAKSAPQRWRVLQSLLEQDPLAARPFLIDGLWDGSVGYRERCIAACDLSWPAVRPRLEALAMQAGSRSASMARARLSS